MFTTDKWYLRNARCVVSCRVVPSRVASNGRVGDARETRTEVETSRRDATRRIGKGACLPADDRVRSSLPETRLAACGFALPLFASLLFSAREVLVPLYFEAVRHRTAGRLCNPSCPPRPRHAEVVARSRRRCISTGCPRSMRETRNTRL